MLPVCSFIMAKVAWAAAPGDCSNGSTQLISALIKTKHMSLPCSRLTGWQADALCRQISARTKDKWSRRGGHDWRHTGHLPATCRVVRQKGTIENYYFNWRQRLHRQRVRPPPPPSPAACRLAQVRQLELKANRLQIASHSLLSQSLLEISPFPCLTLPRLVTQLHLTNCSICCLDLP